MQCRSCRTELPVGATFCPTCGVKVSNATVSENTSIGASSSSGTPEHEPATGYGSPLYGIPRQYPYTPVNPYEIPRQPPPPPPPRRRVKISLLITVGVLVLLLACIGGVTLLSQSAQNSVQNTATPTTSTASSTQTVTTAQNPYPPYHGTLELNDPLRDYSSGNGWGEASNNSGGACQFTGGAYHVSQSNAQQYVAFCYAAPTGFSNFIFEVQMTIIKGDAGGIIFRADATN